MSVISPADLAGYRAKTKGKKIPPGTTTKKGAPISAPEEQLAWQLEGAGIKFHRNFAFHPRRKWQADFLILPQPRKNALLIECEGWGRHQRWKGFEDDCTKYAEAIALGFIVLRVTPRQITTGKALGWVQRVLNTHARRARDAANC